MSVMTTSSVGASASEVAIGLVGYGAGGKYFHSPLIATAAGCRLAGVVTRSPARRGEVATDHPGVPVFDTLTDLAAAGVRAVAISTPFDTHVALAREAIGLGLATLCDKPFTPDADSAQALVDEAEAAGVLLTVYQNRRWDSDFLTVRALLESGRLGTVFRFESRFERYSFGRGPAAAGGGLLRDFGSHIVDQALQLFGPVTSVYAETAAVQPGLDRDDDMFIALTHRDGVTSHLAGQWVQSAPAPRFRVTGTDASYVVDGMDGQEPALIAGRSPGTEKDEWGVEPPERWGTLHHGATHTQERVPSERGRWDSLYTGFAAAVRGEGPVPVDPRDAVAALRVLDAARISATEGRVVALE
jgi:predicted dehydrogenase